MPRSIPCPACSAKLVLPDKLPDNVKSVRCPNCKKSMSVVKKTSTQVHAAPPVESPAPPAQKTPAPETRRMPAAADAQADDIFGDLDNIRLAGDEEAAPQAPQRPAPPPRPAPPQENVSSGDDLVAVEPADEDLVPVEAAGPEEADLVAVEPVAAANDLVELEAADVSPPAIDVEEVEEEEELDELEEVDDRRREPLPGILAYDEFLIKPRASFGSLHYDIQDYHTRDVLGTASEERGVVGFLVGRKAANIVIRDDLRDKTLCTLYRPMSFLKSRVEIRDHKERMLGTVAFRMVQLLGATIFDWDEHEWATIKGKWGTVPAMHIKGAGGKSLGKFTHESFQTKKMVVTFFTEGMSWYVKVNKRLRYDHDGKLLLIASAIAYDMVRISLER